MQHDGLGSMGQHAGATVPASGKEGGRLPQANGASCGALQYVQPWPSVSSFHPGDAGLGRLSHVGPVSSPDSLHPPNVMQHAGAALGTMHLPAVASGPGVLPPPSGADERVPPHAAAAGKRNVRSNILEWDIPDTFARAMP